MIASEERSAATPSKPHDVLDVVRCECARHVRGEQPQLVISTLGEVCQVNVGPPGILVPIKRDDIVCVAPGAVLDCAQMICKQGKTADVPIVCDGADRCFQ